MKMKIFQNPGKTAIKLLVVAFFAALFSNLLVWLVSLMTQNVSSSKWTTVWLGWVSVIGIIYGAWYRFGDESKEVGELFVGFLATWVLFVTFDALGFTSFKFLTDFTVPVGIGTTAATYLIAEGTYQRVIKNF